MEQCDQAPETARTAPAVPASSGRASNDNAVAPLIRVALWRQRVEESGRDDGFSPSHIAMMFALAQVQGANDATYARQERFALRAGIRSPDTAGHVLQDLVDAGVVASVPCCRGCQFRFPSREGQMEPCPVSRGRSVNHYSILWSALDSARITSRRATVARSARSIRAPDDTRSPGVTRLPDLCDPATGEHVTRLPDLCDPATGDKKITEKTKEKTTENTTPPSGGTRAGEVGGVVKVGEVSVMREEQPPQTVERSEQATGETFTLTLTSPKPKKTAAKAKAPRQPRGEHAMPDDWQPTDKHRAIAERDGVDLAREVEKFRGWAQNRKALSWDGRFTTWLSKAGEDAARRPKPTAPAAPAPAVQVDTWSGKWGDGRLMRAKMDGVCLVCTKPIRCGEEQWWYPGDGVRHPGCLGPRAQRGPGLARGGSDYRKQPSGLPAASCPQDWDDIG